MNSEPSPQVAEQQRTMEEYLTALVEASAALTDTLTPPAVSAAVLRLSERLLSADAYAVWRWHSQSARWQIAASSGLSDAYHRATIQMLEKVSGAPDSPVIADDVFAVPMLAERKAAYQAEGIRSLLVVPLRIRGENGGMLAIYHRQPHHFGDIEIRVATALANLAAAAIGSAELYAEQIRLNADRKRSEQDARFLAEASAALAGLVDYQSTLQKVARLAVPTFADWCAVDMLDEDGALRRLAVAHVDPSKVELAHELYRRYPPDPAAPQGAWNIIRTGNSEIVADIDDKLLVATIADAELLRIMRELGLKSYMGVPLSVRGSVLGVITFIAAESGRRYEVADLTIAEDLAHRAAIAIENARLYQSAREADRRKDEFFALLGHELRNPLAPMCNALNVLKLPGADAAITNRARAMMERQVEYMVRLVDDLLDMSRIMRGKIELRTEPVELATVIARAIETAQPYIEAEEHHLQIDIQPEPLWVNGDLVRLAQVFSNLLSNAAKYTDRGGQIWLTARREDGVAVVRVRDTGIGIRPEAFPRLFDMFFQAERRTKESQGGLGIGLSLVRGLVELHGGSAEAYSGGLGQGSEFLVRLPLLAAEEKRVQHRSPATKAREKLPPRRVLVVDDNVDAADSLALLLRLQGLDVEVAYDGVSALEKAEAELPSLAFLDLGMPRMDGYELARAFRARPAFEGIVLVALTGWGQSEDRQRTRAAGFDYHFVKPVEAEALHSLFAERSEVESNR